MDFLFSVMFIFFIDKTDSCNIDEHQCNNGACIPSRSICDGLPDCFDRSDETTELCLKIECNIGDYESGFDLSFLFSPTPNFKCKYGACIPNVFTCNGIPDCADGSDEEEELCKDRRCARGEFRCDYGACITSQFACNGFRNCADGSDETSKACRNQFCPINYFKCNYGACIWHGRKCDGKIDCSLDGSDEDLLLCHSSTNGIENATTLKDRSTTTTTGNSFENPSTDKIVIKYTTPNEFVTREPSSTTSSSTPFQLNETPTELSSQIPLSTVFDFSLPILSTSKYLKSSTSEYTTESSTPLTKSTSKQSTIKSTQSSTPTFSFTSTPFLTTSQSTTTEPQSVDTSVHQSNVTTEQVLSMEVSSYSSNLSTISVSLPTITQPAFTEYSTSKSIGENCPADYCSCLPPSQFMCVPCATSQIQEEQCRTLNENTMCSTSTASGVTLSVLTCGITVEFDISSFSRKETEKSFHCGNEKEVPPDTIVYASCWDAVRSILVCGSDGFWHPMDNNTHLEAVKEICQPYKLNSEVCGTTSRLLRLYKTSISSTNWPWLVGIFRFGGFWCSGTIISKEWILTAGQCVSNLIESEKIDPNEFKIQFQDNTELPFYNVSDIILHPDFQFGHPFQNDVALLRLEESVTFSRNVIPACLSIRPVSNGDIAAFHRQVEQRTHHWRIFSQSIDPECWISSTLCNTAIDLDSRYLCAISNKPISYDLESSTGAPMLLNDASSDHFPKWTLAGVSTFVRIQGCVKKISIYNSIHIFIDWIEKHV